MPSLIPGFEYDIFISYRHNDNRSGWVTDFVNALHEELAATIKEPLSIYFDKNPHDGLLETDSVNKSLEGKLKCFIFIPIISQTYCDPTSFAWQNEFCAFNKLSGQDNFGRDIRLTNGNVKSRILPVKIHDLDPEDSAVIESEIGGALRAIEFIFKSAGVNRPLRPSEEHAQDNLNKTFYRDQVNKVANAIKAIIQAAKAPSNVQPSPSPAAIRQSDPLKRQTLPGKSIFAFVVLIVLISVAFWKYNSRPGELAGKTPQDKSLVVLPFADISPRKDQEWFSDGLTEELLNGLSALEDLKLISRTTSFSFKDKGLSAKRIADSLGVAHVLEGSVRKIGDQLRVTVQLIKANDDTHLWSHVYDYTIDSVFKIQGDISKNVANTLNLLLDNQTGERMYNAGTTSIEAYQEFLKGVAAYREAHLTGNFDQLAEANKFFEKAIQIYPNFARAYYDHADIFIHGLLAEAGIESLNNFSEKEQYERMMNDINKALALSQNSSDKVGYSFTRNIFSKDWSQLPSYLEVKENWASGWEVFLAIIDPEFVSRRYQKIIAIDQNADMIRYWAALGLANMSRLDSALLLYKNDYTKSHVNARIKSVLHFRKGDYPKALEAVGNHESSTDGYSLFLKLLDGRYTKSRAEIEQDLSSQPLFDSYGYSPILAYNALGEYSRADSVASLIDSRILGHCSLGYNLLTFGLYFHLSATPNFAARLRELGIDPEAYEKKHYKKISGIKVPA
jgi:TolB-like protein